MAGVEQHAMLQCVVVSAAAQQAPQPLPSSFALKVDAGARIPVIMHTLADARSANDDGGGKREGREGDDMVDVMDACKRVWSRDVEKGEMKVCNGSGGYDDDVDGDDGYDDGDDNRFCHHICS